MGSEELLSPWDGYFRNVRVRAMLALNLTRRGWKHWIGQRKDQTWLLHGTVLCSVMECTICVYPSRHA